MLERPSIQYYRVTLSMALGAFLIFCNLYLFQPMLPFLATHYSTTEYEINWVFAITSLTLSVCLIPWAVLSERIGKRPVLLIGLFSLPLVGVLAAFAPQLWLLVLIRGLLGVFLAAFLAVGVAYLAEELSEQAFIQAIAIYVAANSIGGITGRLLGGALMEWGGWDKAVEFMSIMSAIGAIVVFLSLPKQRQFVSQSGWLKQHNRALIDHFRNRTLWLAMLIGGVNFALFVNLYTVMSFRLVAAPHNLPAGIAGMIFLCYLAGTLSSSLSAKWRKIGSSSAGIMLGTAIMFSGVIIAYFDHLISIIIGLLLISFGAFLTHTLAYAWVSQKATTGKATAVALYLVHYYVGGSLGGFWLLYCWKNGAWLGVILGSLPLLISLFGLSRSLENNQARLAFSR